MDLLILLRAKMDQIFNVCIHVLYSLLLLLEILSPDMECALAEAVWGAVLL